jgi:GNAT superfamily N-acetyltransferase
MTTRSPHGDGMETGEGAGRAANGIRYVDDPLDAAACYPLMRQLRPHLESEAVFLARWQRQVTQGYRMLALWHDGRPVALAGFRVQENLVHGAHFYVDDLVTDETLRSAGHGKQVMDRLKEEGRRLGCDRLVLDTPLTNVLGHRFYYRNGLLAAALRFNTPLG